MELLKILAAIAIVVYVTTTIRIYVFLHKRKLTKASFLLINFYIFHYVETYKHVTKKENGKIGEMFYSWLFSVNLALLCVLIIVLF